jgi:hypothetical protein
MDDADRQQDGSHGHCPPRQPDRTGRCGPDIASGVRPSSPTKSSPTELKNTHLFSPVLLKKRPRWEGAAEAAR